MNLESTCSIEILQFHLVFVTHGKVKYKLLSISQFVNECISIEFLFYLNYLNFSISLWQTGQYLWVTIFISSLCSLSITLSFWCLILVYMLWWNCSPVCTARFLILFCKVLLLYGNLLFLLNVSILNYAETYYLIALSII